MVPSVALLRPANVDAYVLADGRPTIDYRSRLRHIPSLRNALSLVGLYAQTLAVMWLAVRFSPWAVPFAFIMMGRAHAQFASLMHEAAHRLLFRHKGLNDFVGRWLLGYPQLTSTAAYRRVHMAHHRQEFGPDEPDIPLYANYPIPIQSFRRKLLRDAIGRTGIRLLSAQLRNGLRSSDARIRTTLHKMLLVQCVMLAVAVAVGHWWVYPVLWVLPYFTVWRVINRLRSIAEHGGLRADPDRRVTTHSVRQGVLARFFLVPYNIGFHLAHHVDAGVPFRRLPEYHRHLRESGYVTNEYQYPSYRALWRALSSPTELAPATSALN